MRFILNFAFLALSVLFISCDKDDDGTPADNLPGTWRLVDIHSENGVATITLQGIPLTLAYESEGNSYNTTTTFTENPNEFTSEGSYVIHSTIATPGTPTTYDETVNIGGTGTWSINGDVLTQTLGGETTEIDILELSKTKMRLKYDVTLSEDNQGLIFQTTATIFSIFEKE